MPPHWHVKTSYRFGFDIISEYENKMYGYVIWTPFKSV
jgi:hypothetical protein